MLPRQSNTDKPTNQTDSDTDKAGNDEHQQKRLGSDAGNKTSNPANSRRYKRRNVRENIRQKNTSFLWRMRTKTEKALHALEALNKADGNADETDNDESQNQRIVNDGADKRANPRDGRRDERSDIAEDGCNSGSRCAGINNLPSCWN